ncbi:DUF4136 domain-containing protein [Porticoccus sp. W117]|uniref:DUF4136 domain-containing protein n=1 Tax=Porticoccus sp. W117 TaxID=3054777 RepID=UPI0025916BBB|nr:DUF4136 domain-containing protein [Porticoccus sp. W117]MDM3870528.1 DUF4136 domain-containing protein [Porticoccus sp. W117]
MSLRLLMPFLFLLLSACHQIPVQDIQGSLGELSRFDSYRWGWPALKGGGRHDQDLLLQDRLVRESVGQQLTALGLAQRAEDQTASLVVDYKLLFTPEQYANLEQPQGGWVWKRDQEGELQRSRVDPNATITLDRATLNVTVFNSDKSQVIWEGQASDLVDHSHPPEQIIRAIQKMVKGLFVR